MPPTAKRRQPSSSINEDALPAANQLSFPQQWRSLRDVQRERREQTDELWRRLDDIVTDASDLPSLHEPSPVHRPLDPKLPPLQRTNCAQSCLTAALI